LQPVTVEAIELIKSSINNDLIVNYLATLLRYATNSPAEAQVDSIGKPGFRA